MIDNELKHLPTKQPHILENITCVYCGYSFVGDDWTKEHVVGRKFVPKGKLNGEWNLIVRACEICNGIKSDLENDISAITMQPNASGKYAIEDRDLIREAKRKAKKSFSRRTKKIVLDSYENIKFSAPFSEGINIKGNFTSPPQIDNKRMFELARLQLMGFFYMLTFNKLQNKGYYWVGEYSPLLEAIRSDWGNPVHKWFMNLVKDWEPRLLFIGADGFFKASIRRNPGADHWAWVLEWNHNYRLVGFFGCPETTSELSKKVPSLNIRHVADLDNGYILTRSDIPLNDDDDLMFYWQNKNA